MFWRKHYINWDRKRSTKYMNWKTWCCSWCVTLHYDAFHFLISLNECEGHFRNGQKVKKNGPLFKMFSLCFPRDTDICGCLDWCALLNDSLLSKSNSFYWLLWLLQGDVTCCHCSSPSNRNSHCRRSVRSQSTNPASLKAHRLPGMMKRSEQLFSETYPESGLFTGTLR